MRYPHFVQALRDLAPTDAERARLLGVSERSVKYYLSGDMLPHAATVKRIPELDDALTRDIRPQIPAQMVQIPA